MPGKTVVVLGGGTGRLVAAHTVYALEGAVPTGRGDSGTSPKSLSRSTGSGGGSDDRRTKHKQI
jgi:hypothetical protein